MDDSYKVVFPVLGSLKKLSEIAEKSNSPSLEFLKAPGPIEDISRNVLKSMRGYVELQRRIYVFKPSKKYEGCLSNFHRTSKTENPGGRMNPNQKETSVKATQPKTSLAKKQSTAVRKTSTPKSKSSEVDKILLLKLLKIRNNLKEPEDEEDDGFHKARIPSGSGSSDEKINGPEIGKKNDDSGSSDEKINGSETEKKNDDSGSLDEKINGSETEKKNDDSGSLDEKINNSETGKKNDDSGDSNTESSAKGSAKTALPA